MNAELKHRMIHAITTLSAEPDQATLDLWIRNEFREGGGLPLHAFKASFDRAGKIRRLAEVIESAACKRLYEDIFENYSLDTINAALAKVDKCIHHSDSKS